MSDDEYQNWLRENDAEPTDKDGADPAFKIIPWWAWAMIMMAAAKAIKFVLAAASAAH